ncbi:trans-sialidase [Trypanosoma cruzi cruzi]|uniref:Putative trans-sialidase, Group VI n=1 Tax=Trypanosoma cruzi TaxID=5693 RepID=A0A2V2VB98_TRYCR|nr:trans-sialidase [Trypanosoma cruzi cruzi]PWU93795.1 putative trans-sialidase, Group VI [Trypanosoma cruzi]
MLSRFAAVKAPRTHNRRRVTGSSGRRREGRESEPQRRNMSRHLFYSAMLLLLVVMMCCGSGAAPSSEPSKSKLFVWRDKKDEETVSSLRAPSLVEVNGNVFAVAEAQCKKGEDTFTGIVSQLLKQGSGVGKEEVLKDANTKTKVLEEGASEKKEKVDVSRPTTVVKGSDIYMLVGKCSRTAAGICQESGADDSGLLLVKGDVSGVDEINEQINWEDPKFLPRRLFDTEHELLTSVFGSGGSGVNINDDTLVFPVEAKKKQKETDTEKDVKTVSLIIYSSDNAASWKLSKRMSDDGCSDPSVVEWEKDKLMMMTACGDGRRRVYESGDKGESWTEALGTLSRVWGNKQKGEGAKGVRSGLITATIGDDKRNVMLVTLPVYSEKDGKKEKGELHLWLTDNTHIVDIGPVSEKDEDVTASSLLYKSAGSGDNNEQKEELIALYEKKGDGKPSSYGMVSVLLTEQLQRVKEVVAKWEKVDEIVSKLCASGSTEKSASPENACSAVRITDGLVGFLSGNFSGTTWRDEYLGVNATVKVNGGGATKNSDNGVKFQGAWAEWPVGRQGENQLYHFANHNFTLVATVSIDKVQEEFSPISVMGMKMNDAEDTVLLRLSYNSGGKWKLSCGGETLNELSSTWEPEETHQLAIVLQNGTHGSAYVDGQQVGDAPCALENKDSKVVSHFYIGGDGGSTDKTESRGDVSVTVMNVLLYNRPLSSADITALDTKLSNSKQKDPQAVMGDALAPEVRVPPAPVTVPQTTLGGDKPTAQQSLETSEDTGSDGASTKAVSTVTTSPAGKESVDLLASGASPNGHQNVDTGDGDKTQEDEPHKTPVGNVNAADANAPTTMGEGREGPAVNPEAGASPGGNGEPTEGTNGQEEEVHPQDGEVNTTALSSSLGNVPQGNNSDGGTVSESRMLPSLLLLLLGLWGLAAL